MAAKVVKVLVREEVGAVVGAIRGEALGFNGKQATDALYKLLQWCPINGSAYCGLASLSLRGTVEVSFASIAQVRFRGRRHAPLLAGEL